MGDEGGAMPGVESIAPAHHVDVGRESKTTPQVKVKSGSQQTGTETPSGFRGHMTPSRRHSLDLDDYFAGPMELGRHSKLPMFMRMHGSVVPQMIVPLLCVGAWSTLITCISFFYYPLSVNTVLLTVLGFVVGLALSFRSSTAYERYSDGRRCWITLVIQSRNLARYMWTHVQEREGELGKEDLLGKLTGINMLLAFAVSLKHKLRFEPYAHYDDIADLVGHLDTYANAAFDPELLVPERITPWKRIGCYLGIPFAESNPRKILKRAKKPVGNLPLEILNYLGAYIEGANRNGSLNPVLYGQMLASLAALTDTMGNCERVLTTPLPVGYNILISQIVLLYVYLLPFQLYGLLKWITIPGTIAAAYIILGLALIGDELEDPFGNDVNDLPLDQYCQEIALDLDTITSRPAPAFSEFTGHHDNKVLWPLSTSSFHDWNSRSVADIRSALKSKIVINRTSTSDGGVSTAVGTTSSKASKTRSAQSV
ncbi:hypothetical protein BP5796_06481 [Coleophoma crateriformis]|uniref:Uncharacterized protein n=1 Tax=Coleophoma crateriformis TaxID=565419 RepID=A0A3D8RNX4_9HELO|nr:hypothetical protein BP5796_06481 [Coleophoma crateriformis]